MKHHITRLALVALALVCAWARRLVLDDAFISFRYARNLAEGHGLVWNVGERVEGYTNFLWTLFMAPAFWLGVDVVAWSYALSLAAFAVTLLASARLAETWWQNRAAGTLVIILLACNYSFLCYATGGLETQFGIAWVMLGIWLLQPPVGTARRAVRERWLAGGRLGEASLPRLVCAALASACAVMTRMDAVLLLAPFWCAEIWRTLSPDMRRPKAGNAPRTARRAVPTLFVAVCAGAAPIVAWLLWRHAYYGAWVPNTFLIKSGGPTALRGLWYVFLFYVMSGLFLALPLVVAGRRHLPRVAALPGVVAAWLSWQLYLIKVGGDFMEFRMMMPILPLIMIVFSGLLLAPAPKPWFRAATAVGAVATGMFFSSVNFNVPAGVIPFSVPRAGNAAWMYYAAELQRLAGENKDVKIAITCAGMIPFYTQLPTLDQLGLNDREVALTGDPINPASRWFGNMPGHVRIARWDTLLEKDVNLLINHPWVVDADDKVTNRSAEEIARFWRYGPGADLSKVSVIATCWSEGHEVPPVILWPLGNGHWWVMLYIKPHPAVDAAIERFGAKMILP